MTMGTKTTPEPKPTAYWMGLDGASGLLILLGEGLEPSVEWLTWNVLAMPEHELDVIDVVRWALANGYLGTVGKERA